MTSKKHNILVTDKEGVEKTYSLRMGASLVALRAQQCPIEFDCLKADCGICVVKVAWGQESLSKAQAAELDFLKAMHADPDERLACQCRVFGDLAVKIEF
jgi:ferredoxin